ncbi:hypothetical protein K525DRAFT_203466 [Schizophyllum commune Loenen D]|nr:hypothetical protein K525DRAFT_203466 [Schizophyllum commune Loenen D]
MSAPVHKLPPELLSEIFILAVVSLREFGDGESLHFVVRVLCGICRPCHVVARGTPVLWARIEIDSLNSAHDPLLDLQLQLSRTHPLTIYAPRETLYGDVARWQVLEGIPDEVFPHVEELELEWHSYFLATMHTRDFSSLTTALVTILHEYRYDALDFLGKAHALRRLLLSFEYPCPPNDEHGQLPTDPTSFVPRMPDFPCLTLLSLDIPNDLPVYAIVPLLAKYAPSLRHIQMYSSETVVWPEKSPTTIHEMPALLSVALHMYTHRLLAHITAPALDFVLLYSDRHCEGDPTESLLDLDVMYRPYDALVRCLEQMNGLQCLFLEDVIWEAGAVPRTMAVLERLVCDEDRRPILPELRSLSVQFRAGPQTSLLPEIRALLSSVRRSRKKACVCAGQAVVPLARFLTNADELLKDMAQ